MKILHVVHAYPPSLGGSQILCANLSERMAANYGDEVTVYTTVARNIEYFWGGDTQALPPGIERRNGVTVRRFPVDTRFNRVRWLLAGVAYRLRLPCNDWLRTWQTGPFVPGLRRAVAESGADVIMATAFPLWHMYDALAGAQAGRIPIAFLGALHLADRWGYDRDLIYRAIRRADGYIAHTGYERDYLVQQKQVEAARIRVIGGGVDVLAPDPALVVAQRQTYGWGDDPVILSLGKQVSRKRFDLLIAAMPPVWQRYPQARLVIAGGQTPYHQELQGLIQALPSDRQSNITLISDVKPEQKAGLLAACDIFALASGQESFGIAFIEAWSYAKPVIGANSGAIAAVIEDGVDGLLFDYPESASLAQAILTLLDEPVRRKNLGLAGYGKVQANYTLDRVVEQARDLYVQMVSRPSRSSFGSKA